MASVNDKTKIFTETHIKGSTGRLFCKTVAMGERK